jgi:plastocyanin
MLYTKSYIMKSFILLTVILLAASNLCAQVTHTVQADGFAYSPATLTINIGDSVHFDVGASHPTREVSQATWNDNGTTLLQGGFDFAGGVGTVGFPDAGTFYYVCTVHVGLGMKGKITVQTATPVNSVYEDDFTLYPDPLTSNELTIQLNRPLGNTNFQVFDLSGSLRLSVQPTTAGNTIQLDCSALRSGVYLLKITTPDGVLKRKFVKL